MTAIEVSASGLSAQRRRLEVLVSNLVNANTTQAAGKDPYRRKEVVFSATPPESSFSGALDDAFESVRGVEVTGVVSDTAEPVKRYEPNHPHADKHGFVLYPNVNPMEEMTNVLAATRSYEANLQAVNSVKEMAQRSLEILR
jgi:flagellar basal-body rod protein FlgC